MAPDDPRHGTPAGYHAEVRAVRKGRLGRTCDRCRAANRDDTARRRKGRPTRQKKQHQPPGKTSTGRVVEFPKQSDTAQPKKPAPPMPSVPNGAEQVVLVEGEHTAAVDDLVEACARFPEVGRLLLPRLRSARRAAQVVDGDPGNDKMLRELRLLTVEAEKVLLTEREKAAGQRGKRTVKELLAVD